VAIITRRSGGGPRAPIAETIPLAAVAEMAGPLERRMHFFHKRGRWVDTAGDLRRKAFPCMLANFEDPIRLAGLREDPEGYIAKTVGGVWRPSCTSCMVPPGDTMAATNARGKVRGVERLYIRDA
jgi:hypothetical protein